MTENELFSQTRQKFILRANHRLFSYYESYVNTFYKLAIFLSNAYVNNRQSIKQISNKLYFFEKSLYDLSFYTISVINIVTVFNKKMMFFKKSTILPSRIFPLTIFCIFVLS